MNTSLLTTPQIVKHIQAARQRRQDVIEAFADRGITVDLMSEAVMEEWKMTKPNQKKRVKRAILRNLADPKLHSSVFWGLAFDQLAQEGKLKSKVVTELVNQDDSLVNTDEKVAQHPLTSIEGGVDRFGVVDRLKPVQLLNKLDGKKNPTTDEPQTNMMADDLVVTVMVMAEKDLIKQKVIDPKQPRLTKEKPSIPDTKTKPSKSKKSKKRVPTAELENEVAQSLQDLGVSESQVAEKAFKMQKPFNPDLEKPFAEEQVGKLLKVDAPHAQANNRERAYHLLFLAEVAHLQENPEHLPAPLRKHLEENPREALSAIFELTNSTANLVSDIARGNLANLRDQRSGETKLSVKEEISDLLTGSASAEIASAYRKEIVEEKKGTRNRLPSKIGTKPITRLGKALHDVRNKWFETSLIRGNGQRGLERDLPQ